MKLNSQQREQVRLSVLRWLETSPKYGLTTGLLLQYILNEGFRGLEKSDLNGEMQYLADKGCVVKTNKLISPENEMWRNTAAGRDYLAEAGNE